jgi:signal transduction histidine kinase
MGNADPSAINASGDARGQLVWLVDDSPLESKAAHRALSGQFQMVLFDDPSRMLEQLSSAEVLPDALVLDWMMPGLTGLEVCRYIRSAPRTVDLPVLLLTSNQGTAEVVEGLAAGANDYVSKPYAPQELLARVAALVRAKLTREQAVRAEFALIDVLQNHPDPLLTVRFDGTIAFANTEALAMLGLSLKDKVVGRPLQELLPQLTLPDQLAAKEVALLPDLKLGDAIYEPAVRHLPPGGGGVFCISLRDVTSKRNADLRRLDFYSMVAHDLRSPMQAITLRLQLLQRRYGAQLGPAGIADSKLIDDRVRVLATMLNDFLDLAKIEGTGLHLEREPTDMVAVFKDEFETMAPLVEGSGIEVTMGPGPAEARVIGDPRRLRQVAGNLLSNAMKFTPRGGKVTARVATTGSGVRCEVEDTGRGIPAGAIPSLFNRYTRVVNPAMPVQGTGLGLLIVREVVEAHGGTFGVKSALGSGSTFWFELPAA